VPYAMAIAATRGSSWSFLGRVFGHFFDLGCHRGRFEKGISIFWGFEKIAFLGRFLGVFWGVFGEFLGVFWRVFGGFLEGFWRVFGGFWVTGSRHGILEKVL